MCLGETIRVSTTLHSLRMEGASRLSEILPGIRFSQFYRSVIHYTLWNSCSYYWRRRFEKFATDVLIFSEAFVGRWCN